MCISTSKRPNQHWLSIVETPAVAAPVAAPAPAVSPIVNLVTAEYEDIPLTNMRKVGSTTFTYSAICLSLLCILTAQVIATRLTEAKQTVPHYYLSIDVQMDSLLALRERLNKAGMYLLFILMGLH